jgi:hypothetical protein
VGADVGVAGTFEERPQGVIVSVPGVKLDSGQVGNSVDVAGDLLGQGAGPGVFEDGGVEVVEPELLGAV